MSGDLRTLFPDLVDAIEHIVDERLEAALAERENGSVPAWMSIEEAAAYLRVSPRTISRLREQGRLRVSHVGRRVLVNRADLDAAAAAGGTQ